MNGFYASTGSRLQVPKFPANNRLGDRQSAPSKPVVKKMLWRPLRHGLAYLAKPADGCYPTCSCRR